MPLDTVVGVWWRDHLGLLVGLLTSAFVAARLLFVARFDVDTAATVLDVLGVGTVVAGTTLTLLPFALGLAAVALAVVVYADPSLSPLTAEPARVLLAVCTVAALCLLPAEAGLAVLGIVIALAVASWRRAGEALVDLRAVARHSRVVRTQLRALAVLAVLTPLALQRPWLPTETVVVSVSAPAPAAPAADAGPDTETHVGYVLGDKQGSLALLDETTRSVVLVAPDAVTDRWVCTGRVAQPGAGPVNRVATLRLHRSLVAVLLFGDDVPRYRPCGSPGG